MMFGTYDTNGELVPSPMELVRLAIPRRVYTQSHIDYVAEAVCEVFAERKSLAGLRITYEAPVLRHFTAHFEQIPVLESSFA
jgi:tryptophanase